MGPFWTGLGTKRVIRYKDGRGAPKTISMTRQIRDSRSLRMRDRPEDSNATPPRTTSLTWVVDGCVGRLGTGAGRGVILGVGRVYLFAGL